MDQVMRNEYRAGVYRSRRARWIDQMAEESGRVEADIAGCLTAIAAGQRDFSYPRHDQAVYGLLAELVPQRRIRRGADIGCATGCFPAMQLAVGVEHCTVFELRDVVANDERVEVRIQEPDVRRRLGA